MDLAKSGQSYNKHIQTVSSKRAAEEIQGIKKVYLYTYIALYWFIDWIIHSKTNIDNFRVFIELCRPT